MFYEAIEKIKVAHFLWAMVYYESTIYHFNQNLIWSTDVVKWQWKHHLID